jgi:hypothetical protein
MFPAPIHHRHQSSGPNLQEGMNLLPPSDEAPNSSSLSLFFWRITTRMRTCYPACTSCMAAHQGSLKKPTPSSLSLRGERKTNVRPKQPDDHEGTNRGPIGDQSVKKPKKRKTCQNKIFCSGRFDTTELSELLLCVEIDRGSPIFCLTE